MYETARTDVHNAWTPIQHKYAAIAAKRSTENPTGEELQRLDVARSHQQMAERMIDVFIKLHFPNT